MDSAFKYLIVADESAEFPAALAYVAYRARQTGAAIVMLHVIEPTEPAEWVSVAEEIRRQAAEGAEALTQRFAAEVWAETGLTVEVVIREGDLRSEIRRLLDEDRTIKVLALAAGGGQVGPGPLVSSVAKGQSLGGRPVPVLVVPGHLNREELKALAGPEEAGSG